MRILPSWQTNHKKSSRSVVNTQVVEYCTTKLTDYYPYLNICKTTHDLFFWVYRYREWDLNNYWNTGLISGDFEFSVDFPVSEYPTKHQMWIIRNDKHICKCNTQWFYLSAYIFVIITKYIIVFKWRINYTQMWGKCWFPCFWISY